MPAAVLGLCTAAAAHAPRPAPDGNRAPQRKAVAFPKRVRSGGLGGGGSLSGGGDGSDTDSSVTNAGPHSPGPPEHPEMTAGRLKSRASTRGRPDADAQSSRPPSSVPRADGARAPRGLPSAQAAGRRREEPRVGRRGAPGATH